MRGILSKIIIGAIIILIIIFAGVFVLLKNITKKIPVPIQVVVPAFKQEVIGKSVVGRNIEAYTFGNGQNQLVFVGGIHGGYEWNSVLLAYKFIDYLKAKK